jgi:Leucine-rich repeat (LRR) protein
LKILNLSNSKYLTRSPDFSRVPQLEILILEGCTSLVQVHESIGYLKRLVLLNLKNCTNLKYIPRSIFNLESLKTLDLSDCSTFEKLSEQIQSSFGLLMNLKIASFSGCSGLIELPNLHAPHLESLELEGCTSLVQIHESIGHLKRLVSLNLKNCTKLKHLPRSIVDLESLETLDLSGCLIFEKLPNQQPSSFGLFMNLKTASFSRCSSLIELPNFSHAPHLESLNLKGCTSLVEIHESVGFLKRLVSLNLWNCQKIRSLPSSISNLESLEILELFGCDNLEKLPENLGKMKALKSLMVDFTAIKQLPSSFSLLENLEYLSFVGCNRLINSPEFSQISRLKKLNFFVCRSLVKIHESIGHLKRLEVLDLSNCTLSDDEIPIEFGYLSSLQTLRLSRNNFHNLPSCISRLPKLESLRLSESTNLQSISVPRGIRFLAANGCTSLESISILTNDSSESSYLDDLDLHGETYSSFDLNNCSKLVEIQNLESLRCVPCTFRMGGCNNLSSEFR